MRANTGRTLELLRKHGVVRAAFHPDGKLASVELGSVVEKSSRKRLDEPMLTKPQRTDLDVLSELPSFEDN